MTSERVAGERWFSREGCGGCAGGWGGDGCGDDACGCDGSGGWEGCEGCDVGGRGPNREQALKSAAAVNAASRLSEWWF